MTRTIIAVALTLALAGCSSTTDDNSEQMITACQDKVLEQIKSPGSASFGDQQIVTGDARKYTRSFDEEITMWVDSQNSKGALIRADVTCGVQTSDGIRAQVLKYEERG